MQLVITDDDMRGMSPSLRSGLLAYLTRHQVKPSDLVDEVEDNGFHYVSAELGRRFSWDRSLIVLEAQQAENFIAELDGAVFKALKKLPKDDLEGRRRLIDDISRSTRVLKRLMYLTDVEAPTSDELTEEAKLRDRRRLGPCLGSINAALKRITGNADAHLYHVDEKRGIYIVHASTRDALRKGYDRWMIRLQSA